MRYCPQPRFLTACFVAASLACSRETEVQPVPRSTELITRIVQTSLDSASARSFNAWDTLHFYKLADGYHRTDNATDTRYAYDEQGRLVTQTTDAYRNDGDYGHEVKHLVYDFTYADSALVVTRMGSAKTGAGAYTIPVRRQPVLLNEQGKVRYPPTMPGAFYWSDNGISSLFSNAVYPLGTEDTLRVYDTEGYLVKAELVDNRYGDKTLVNQTITNGNVERTDFTYQDGRSTPSNPGVPTTLLYHYQYDKSAPGLRNPHQFLGNTSRNLLTKTLQTNPTNGKVQTTNYSYEYDSKNRVKRYIMSAGSYLIVGDITY